MDLQLAHNVWNETSFLYYLDFFEFFVMQECITVMVQSISNCILLLSVYKCGIANLQSLQTCYQGFFHSN